MKETLRLIAPYLYALALAWMAYYLVINVRFRSKIRRSLDDFYAEAGSSPKEISRGERIGNQIAARLPFSLEAWEGHLKWAQRDSNP